MYVDDLRESGKLNLANNFGFIFRADSRKSHKNEVFPALATRCLLSSFLVVRSFRSVTWRSCCRADELLFVTEFTVVFAVTVFGQQVAGSCVITTPSTRIICTNGINLTNADGFVQVGVGAADPGAVCGLTRKGHLQCVGGTITTISYPSRNVTQFSIFGPFGSPGGNYSQFSIGTYHSCAISASSRLSCFGCGEFSNSGQCSPPTGLLAVQVSAGYLHTCVLLPDYSAQCFGDNGIGQSNAPDGQFAQISAGAYHTCALRVSGDIVCFGDNTYGQSSVPQTGPFTAVSAAAYHTCIITILGTVQCFGCQATEAYIPPLCVVPALTAPQVQISCSSVSCCSISIGSIVTCFGCSSFSGCSTTFPSKSEFSVLWTSAPGYGPSFALTVDNFLAPWSWIPDNWFPLLSQPSVMTLSTGIVQQTIAWMQAPNALCMINSTGSLICSCNSGNSVSCVTSGSSSGRFVQLSSSVSHILALHANGRVFEIIGTGFDLYYGPPSDLRFLNVAAGDLSACGVLHNGTVICWYAAFSHTRTLMHAGAPTRFLAFSLLRRVS